MKIQALIVDDEPYAAAILEKYLAQFTYIELAGKCADAAQALQFLQKNHIDLLLLDIQMPGIKGTDLLRSLAHPPKVIFTTAHSQYALEGFELNAVDYLLKPISLERFQRAVEKAYPATEQHIQFHPAPEAPVSDHETFIYLKVDRKTVKVNVNDILWIESLRDYVKVVTGDNEYITRQKISILEEMLPESRFIRIHRSFIVALPKITSFYAYSIGIGNRELPIGRNYKADVQQKLKAGHLPFS